MVDLLAGIRTLINGIDAVDDILSERVFAMDRPQDLPQLPCVLMHNISLVPNNTKTQKSTVDSVLVQLTFIGNYTEGLNVMSLIRDVLDTYSGEPYSGVLIQEIVYKGRVETSELDYMVADSLGYDGSQSIMDEYMVRVATGY